MALYKMIIVDDEDEVRESIRKKIDWEELGFELVGSACNGEEALEMAEAMSVDVVMTDIKMPFMDGLTLAGKLKENYQNTKIVVYSGFDEFEFAQEAIHLEVEEYLLKPINPQELIKVFSKIKENLDKEIDEKRNAKKLYEHYLKSIPMMQEQVLVSLLHGRIQTEKAVPLLQSYDLEMNGNYYSVAVFHFCPNEYVDNIKEQMDYLSLLSIVNDYCNEILNVHSFLYLDKVIVIATLKEKDEISAFHYHIEQICKKAKRILDVNLSAGIGRAYSEVGELSISFNEASSALEYRVFVGANQAIYIQDVEPKQKAFTALEHYSVNDIFNAIKLGTREELEKAISYFISSLKQSKMGINQYRFIFMELIIEIVRLVRLYDLELDYIVGENFDLYRDIEKFHSLDELEEWLYKICLNMRQLMKKQKCHSTKLLTENAQKYVEDNYSDCEFSVEKICKHLGVSPSYFSTIFKKETGMSFVSYLAKVRMEHAVDLLNNTDEKSYFIAEQVGYLEPNYFSYVFKKQYGVSPTKYRTIRKEE